MPTHGSSSLIDLPQISDGARSHSLDGGGRTASEDSHGDQHAYVGTQGTQHRKDDEEAE